MSPLYTTPGICFKNQFKSTEYPRISNADRMRDAVRKKCGGLDSGAPIPLSQWCILYILPISTTYINSPISAKFINFSPHFCSIYAILLNLRLFPSPILTMMHLCIMLYTYWTPHLDFRGGSELPLYLYALSGFNNRNRNSLNTPKKELTKNLPESWCRWG